MNIRKIVLKKQKKQYKELEMRNTWENRGYWGLKEEERTNNRRAIYLKSMKE